MKDVIEKLPIAEKAFEVLDTVAWEDSGYMPQGYEWECVIAESVSKAKMKVLRKFESPYLQIRVRRAKRYDKVLFEGKPMRKEDVRELLNKRQAIAKIMAMPDNECFFLQDGRNYVGNSILWHAQNGCGYTTDITKAHRYTKEEILKDKYRNTDAVWAASHVLEHIKMHVDRQYLDGEFCMTNGL